VVKVKQRFSIQSGAFVILMIIKASCCFISLVFAVIDRGFFMIDQKKNLVTASLLPADTSYM